MVVCSSMSFCWIVAGSVFSVKVMSFLMKVMSPPPVFVCLSFLSVSSVISAIYCIRLLLQGYHYQ